MDAAKGAGDLLFSANRSVVALAPGASSSGTATLTIPTTTAAGIYYLLACADDRLAVAEADETNNCRASTGTVTVQLPDLVETSVAHASGPHPGPSSP